LPIFAGLGAERGAGTDEGFRLKAIGYEAWAITNFTDEGREIGQEFIRERSPDLRATNSVGSILEISKRAGGEAGD
jgi:hypothetical protein